MKISEGGMYGLLVILYMFEIDCAPGGCVSHLNAAGLNLKRVNLSIFKTEISLGFIARTLK